MLRKLLVLSLLAFLAATRLSAGLADRPEIAERLALFSLWVEDQRVHLRQAGVSIAVVHDQEIVWAKGFGLADVASGRLATAETVYRLGSISKTFTAVALLALVDDGRLRLDDPVAKHLPGFVVRGPFAEQGPITVWHLLTHTSGLPREAAFPYWTDRRFPSRDEMLAGLARQELLFAPGSDYQYSNLGLALAGHVAEAAAGVPYARLVEERVLKPLGLRSTFVELPPAGLVATGYLPRRADGTVPVAPLTESNGLAPAANLSSNVLDLGRYLSSLFAESPTALLKPATRRELGRVQWLSSSWSSGRGLGFSVSRQGSRTLVGHGGWVAGHRGQIAFDPVAKIGVAVLTNSDMGGPGDYVRQAFELLAPAIEKAAAPPSKPLVKDDLERFVGTYLDPWGARTEVLVLDGTLVLFDHSFPPPADAAGSLTRLQAEGGGVFRISGGPRRARFERLSDGRVARLQIDENYLYPEHCEIAPDLACAPRDE